VEHNRYYPQYPTKAKGIISALESQLHQRSKQVGKDESYSHPLSVDELLDRFQVAFVCIDQLEIFPRPELDNVLSRLRMAGRCMVQLYATQNQSHATAPQFSAASVVDFYLSEDDLRRFIERQLSNVQQNISELIVSRIVRVSRQNFLVAKLLCRLADSLPSMQDEDNTEAQLHQIYSEHLKRIRLQPQPAQDMALRALGWMIHAKASLKASELCHALSLREGFLTGNEPRWISDSSIILNSCLGLLTADEYYIRFVNDSAFEYCFKHAMDLYSNSHRDMATTCLSYLQIVGEVKPTEYVEEPNENDQQPNESSDSEQDSDDLQHKSQRKPGFMRTMISVSDPKENQYPFWYYASGNWGNHLKDADDPSLEEQAWKYLTEENSVLTTEKWGRRSTPLHVAARFGLHRIVRRLVAELHADVNLCHDSKYAITEAAENGHLATVQLLVESGANVQVTDRNSRNPLIAAASAGHVDVVKLLLTLGLPPNGDLKRAHPLHEAVSRGHLDVAKLLIRYGADTSDSMLKAISSGSIATVQLLLRHMPRDVSESGFFSQAIQESQLEMAKLLLSHGFNTETEYRTSQALSVAVEVGMAEIVGPLLEAGANILEDRGRAIHEAISKRRPKLFQLLFPLAIKANPDSSLVSDWIASAVGADDFSSLKVLVDTFPFLDLTPTVESSWTLLHTAATRNSPEIMAFLLERIDGLETRDSHGLTPLQHAVSQRGHSKDVVEVLLQHGANVNTHDYSICTPLHRVVSCSEKSTNGTLDLILTKGPLLEIHGEDLATPLLAAASKASWEAVSRLLELGAIVSCRNMDGESALHFAVLDRYPKVVEELLDAGIETSFQCKSYGTALHLASAIGEADIVRTLLSRKADHSITYHYSGTSYEGRSRFDRDTLPWRRHWTVPKRHRPQRPHLENGWIALHCAVAHGNLDSVKALLQFGSDIEARTLDNQTPLHLASSANHPDIISFLLSKGADPHVTDRDGNTFLHLAAESRLRKAALETRNHQNCGCRQKHERVSRNERRRLTFQSLLKLPVDVAARNANNETALDLAASAGHEDIVYIILSSMPTVEEPDFASLLQISVAHGRQKLVKELASHPKNPGLQSASWDKILLSACRNGDLETAEVAAGHGGSIEKGRKEIQQTFQNALRRENLNTVRFLIEKDYVDLEEKDHEGKNALHQICTFISRTFKVTDQTRSEIADLLIKHGVNPDHRTKSGQTALHLAVASMDVNLVRTLLTHGASVEIRDQSGSTPLLVASKHNFSTGIIDLLLQVRSYPSAQDHEGYTPLHKVLASHQAANSVDSLLKAGADITIQSRSLYSILHHCVEYSDERERDNVLEQLLEAGAISLLEIGANFGETAFQIAAKHATASTLKMLLKHGANIDALDDSDWHAIHYAASGGNLDTMAYLLSRGCDVNQLVHGRDGTALHTAVLKNDVDMISLLHSNKADLNISDHTNRTPLQRAIEEDKFEAFDLLLRLGADPNVGRLCSPLEETVNFDDAEMAKILLEHGANANLALRNGETPLHVTAAIGNVKIGRMLLENGAIPLSLTDDEKSPIRIAEEKGHEEFVNLIKGWVSSSPR
jgi:ankyrin repeat protein